jgi:hypothetical protein
MSPYDTFVGFDEAAALEQRVGIVARFIERRTSSSRARASSSGVRSNSCSGEVTICNMRRAMMIGLDHSFQVKPLNDGKKG